jgi:hypothetical protein
MACQWATAVCVLLIVPLGAAAETADITQSGYTSPSASRTEINKQLTDPISLTWSLKVKNTIDFEDVGDHGIQGKYRLEFQPTMPLLLGTNLKLITRPEFTFLEDTPYSNAGHGLSRSTGLGDTILDVVLAPTGPWLLGLGPTFVFPTGNLDQTGQGKWQAGPAGALGYHAADWLAVGIAQQWWSFAGSPERKAVSELHLQYIASYFFGDGWSIGTSPTIEVNWRADAGERVTFPIGPTIAKVVKIFGDLPLKLELQGLYMPVYPSPNGDRYTVQVTLTPVMPSPIQQPLCAIMTR